MVRQFCIAALLVFGGPALLARADSQASETADSPKAALKQQDAAAKSGNLDADLSFYKADDEQQKKLARVIAEGDLAVAKLEQTIGQKFGKDLANQAVRAAGTEDAAAIDSASEKVDGDHATIQFRDQQSAVPMVRVDGKWKISLGDWTRGASTEQIDRLIDTFTKFTAGLQHIADLVAHDKFRSGEGARDRVQELHDSLFGARPG